MKKKPARILSELKKGQKATIKGFVEEEKSLRLIEMGLFPGIEVSVVFSSFIGGPLYINYEGGNSHLLLNKKQASLVLIN